MISLAPWIAPLIMAGSAPLAAAPSPPKPPISMVASASRAGHLAAQILWIDGTANAATLHTPEAVRRIVDRSRAAHINAIVVDVKPLSGLALYDSKIAPRMTEWQGIAYPRDFDLLRAFCDAAIPAHIPVYASINTFSEGHKSFRVGPAYSHKDWQVTAYTVRSFATVNGQRLPIDRIDESPAEGEIAAFTPALGTSRILPAGSAWVAYDATDRITASGDGSGAPVDIPVGGGLIVGRGSAAARVRSALTPAGSIRWDGETRLEPAAESASERYAVFVNSLDSRVQKRALAIVREIVSRYPVAGIYLDRMRYPNLHADFSPSVRRAFERFVGHRVIRWPEDVLTFAARPGAPYRRGPDFNPWLEFRARSIHDFLLRARRTVDSTRKGTQIGVYVGSWYSAYFDVGVNWGSPSFPVRYDWMTARYASTGYAPLLDLLCAGTYYPTAWKADALAAGRDPGATVEGSAEEVLEAVRDETAAYGSLYLLQYRSNPEAFRQAIRASLAATAGVMLFDLSYLDEYDWWDAVREELAKDAEAPNAVPGFVASIRDARHAADAATGAAAVRESRTAAADHPPL